VQIFFYSRRATAWQQLGEKNKDPVWERSKMVFFPVKLVFKLQEVCNKAAAASKLAREIVRQQKLFCLAVQEKSLCCNDFS
jgi:hypothetical protein